MENIHNWAEECFAEFGDFIGKSESLKYLFVVREMNFYAFFLTKTTKIKDGDGFVPANFISCLPKEKAFKQLLLHLDCLTEHKPLKAGQIYTQEEANRMCDALLTLSCSSLQIGVGAVFLQILRIY